MESAMSVLSNCKEAAKSVGLASKQLTTLKSQSPPRTNQDWAGHGVLVGCPQLPPHLVSTNESERHLSEPIKATAPLAAQQSAPDLGRGCF